MLTTTVYVPLATFFVVVVVPSPVFASAATAVPLTTLIEAPETLVVTVIAPSLKAENFDLSVIASSQYLWALPYVTVTF